MHHVLDALTNAHRLETRCVIGDLLGLASAAGDKRLQLAEQSFLWPDFDGLRQRTDDVGLPFGNAQYRLTADLDFLAQQIAIHEHVAAGCLDGAHFLFGDPACLDA